MGIFLGGRNICSPVGANLGLKVEGSIKFEEEKSLAWPFVRREASSQIFLTWTFQCQHIKTRSKFQWSIWDIQPRMRQNSSSPLDCDPAKVSFFLGLHRLGKCSALLDLDQCSWHLYRGAGPRNGSIWNQVSLERAHGEVWRLHGNRYPDPELNWWPEQSQLWSQGMVYLHKLSLAVIITANETSFLHWQVSKPCRVFLGNVKIQCLHWLTPWKDAVSSLKNHLRCAVYLIFFSFY